jgi:hypothetical protein
MGLCAAAHLPDEPAGVHRHGVCGKRRFTTARAGRRVRGARPIKRENIA